VTPPALPPRLKPFNEAVAFIRERKPQQPEVYRALDADTRVRSMSIAGLGKMSALIEAQRLATEAIAEGRTIAEFNESLASLIEANGGTLLSRARLDLIFRNLNGIATSAGRYRQIIEGGIAEMRPWGQYPLGPDDSATSAFCRRLQGLVFRLDSAMARHIWPIKHHGCRHLNIATLTDEQAKASGRMYQGSQDDEYPFLEDPETGQASRVLPDPGFDFDPRSLLSIDGVSLAERASQLAGEVEKKTAADYGLARLDEIPMGELPEVPTTKGRAPKSDRLVWEAFRTALGFRWEDSATLADFIGEGVAVTRDSFDAVMAESGADKARHFALIRLAIEEPLEAWLVPFMDEGGEVRYVRRYIGLFGRGVDRRVAVVVDRSPDGWLMGARFFSGGALPESERRGLLTSTRVKKKNRR
jgi:hypothetical protein